MEVNPLSIILVKSDSKGDRLLFRYPYNVDTQNENNKQKRRRSPYSISIQEDILQSPPPQTSNILQGDNYISFPYFLIIILMFKVYIK